MALSEPDRSEVALSLRRSSVDSNDSRGVHPEPGISANLVDENARRLAQAAKHIDNPDDVYKILGSLTSAVASVQRSLWQLAVWHHDNTKHVTADDGHLLESRFAAQRAAVELSIAVTHANEVHAAVRRAHRFSGAASWQAAPVRRLPPAPGLQQTSKAAVSVHSRQIQQ